MEKTATAEQLEAQLTNMSNFATKRELIWLADIVNVKAEAEDVRALKLRFQEVDQMTEKGIVQRLQQERLIQDCELQIKRAYDVIKQTKTELLSKIEE